MIDFHRLTPEYREQYTRLLLQSGERGCEYSFANLNLWGRQRIAFQGNHVLLFSQYGQRCIYLFPLGTGDLKPALDAVLDDARQRGLSCRIASMTQPECELLERLYPGRFRFHPDRDSFDYVYRIEDLATLRGKRYQSRRNFVNRFHAAHPDCQALPLNSATAPAAREMVERWFAERSREEPDMDFHLEQTALCRAFRHMEDYALEGLVLMEQGQVIAMTMGSFLSEDTFDIHFEKALDREDGSYAAIAQAFAHHLREKYPQLQYLNREDDMGIPGLRKAKLSLHPDHMVEKYWARLWEDEDEA